MMERFHIGRGFKTVLLVNCEEPTEPGVYLIDFGDAPAHMKRAMVKSGKTRFNVMDDGVQSMNGLVEEDDRSSDDDKEDDENDEEARATAVIDYIRSKCKKEFEFKPAFVNPFIYPIDAYISLAAC